jgi:chromosome segregation ATPase
MTTPEQALALVAELKAKREATSLQFGPSRHDLNALWEAFPTLASALEAMAEEVGRLRSDNACLLWEVEDAKNESRRLVEERDRFSEEANAADARVVAVNKSLVNAAAALSGVADDYMTSEQHHPGYVLIPTAKFEQLRRAALTAGGDRG